MTSQPLQRNHLEAEPPPTQRNRSDAMRRSASIKTQGLIRCGLLLLIAVYPICFMWQGLDVTDTGYCLVNSQQFFHAYPNDFGDAQCTAYWLTNLMGACWYKLTGECGLIGFRIFYVLLNYCALGLVYLALRGFKFEKILMGLFAAEAFCVGKGFYFPSYNQVTSLFFVASAAALCGGLVRRSGVLVLAGGLIAGMSVFVRIVNFPIILLTVGVWFYHYISQANSRSPLGSLRKSAGEMARFVLGFVCGIAVIILLVAALGHLGAFRNMFSGLFGMASDAKGGYTPVRLLKAFVWDYLYTGLFAIGFVAVVLLIGAPAVRTRRAICALVCVIVVTFVLLKFPAWNIWAIPAMVYLVLLAAASGMLGCRIELRLLCVVAGIVLFVTPLGSGDGMYNSVYGMYLAIPAAFMALITSKAEALPTMGSGVSMAGIGERARPEPLKLRPGDVDSALGGRRLFELAKLRIMTKVDTIAVAWFFAVSIIIFSIVYRVGFTYRDSPDRRAMCFAVQHPKLWGIFTTASRARALNELLQRLKPLVRKDDYLLDHMQLPLLYFLTETRPYLFTSWANLYQPPAFKKAMERALATRSSLPVCVMTKVDTSHPKWPDETYPTLNTYRFSENRRMIQAFAEAHAYKKRWENSAFEIWTATP